MCHSVSVLLDKFHVDQSGTHVTFCFFVSAACCCISPALYCAVEIPVAWLRASTTFFLQTLPHFRYYFQIFAKKLSTRFALAFHLVADQLRVLVFTFIMFMYP